MKLVDEGRFTAREDRQAAMKTAFRHAGVHAFTLGRKGTGEIYEAIENVNLALAQDSRECFTIGERFLR